MTVFVCVDTRGGLIFNDRRQSRDPKVIEDVIRTAGDGILYISDFSEDLFSDSDTSVISVPNPLLSAGEGAFVFVENLPLSPYADKIDKLIVYNWGEPYPFDMKLDLKPTECGFRLRSRRTFAGIAHDKITREDFIK